MDQRLSDARSDAPQSKHAVPAKHYAAINDSPFVQIGSTKQHTPFPAQPSGHSNINKSPYDRLFYTMHLTAREIENNILETCNRYPLGLQHLQMQQYPQEIGSLFSANFPHTATSQLIKNTPLPRPLLSVKQDKDHQSVSQENIFRQTHGTAQEYDIDLPLPEKVSYQDARQHFIRLKKYMDVFYQQISKTEDYEAKNTTDEGHTLHKATDYLHYLFLDTYLTLVGHEDHLKQQEALKLPDQVKNDNKLEHSAEDREVFKTCPTLDAIEIICRLGHIDSKNYSWMIANVLEQEQVPENYKTNAAKMDAIPRIDIYNIHGLTDYQCQKLRKSKSPEDALKMMLKQRFLPKFRITPDNEEEEKKKLTDDIQKYILKEHYNHNNEKEIIFARITKSEIEYKIVSKNEYIKGIKSAYGNIKKYPHSQITEDFSMAEQNFEERAHSIEPSFESHSISEADALAAEIIAPVSLESFGPL